MCVDLWAPRPDALGADKGYDGKPCRLVCAKRGIRQVISRKGMVDHIGRWRWPVERTNAWLHEFKRLGLRYDRLVVIHQAFLIFGCAIICLKRLVMVCRDF